MRGAFGGEASLEYSIHQILVEKLKFYMLYKFVDYKLVYFKNNAYICTQI